MDLEDGLTWDWLRVRRLGQPQPIDTGQCKKIMKGLLPEEVIHRKKKGFGVPIAKWVKGPLKELFGDLLSYKRIEKEGFLNPKYVTSLLEDHLSGKKDNRKQLWTLLVWELWLNRYHPSI